MTTSYRGRGLAKFIQEKMDELNEIKRRKSYIQNRVPELVLWQYNGPIILQNVRQGWEWLVEETVDATNYILDSDRNDRFDTKLADSLFHLYDFCPAFFDRMSMLDPTDCTNGGYYLLQLFLVFLQEDRAVPTDKKLKAGHKKLREAMRDTYLLRKLMREWVIADADYIKQDRTICELARPPDQPEEEWRERVEKVLIKLLAEEVNPDNPHAELLDTFKAPRKSIQPDLDARHLVVFAKATKTRIFYVNYNRKDEWRFRGHQKDSFTCCELDGRDDTGPRCKYTSFIPEFGDNFDFYRTAIIMKTPACTHVVDDVIVWDGKWGMFHYTMWLPKSYDPTIKVTYDPSSINVTVRPTNVNEVVPEAASTTVIQEEVPPPTQHVVNEVTPPTQHVVNEVTVPEEAPPPRTRTQHVVNEVTVPEEAPPPRTRHGVNEIIPEAARIAEPQDEIVLEAAGKCPTLHSNEVVQDVVIDALVQDEAMDTHSTNGDNGVVLQNAIPVDDVVLQDASEGEEEEVVEDRKGRGIRNIWSMDSADGGYVGSSNWMIIEWLKTGQNYELWMNKKDENGGQKTKKEWQSELADAINEAGKNFDPPRKRTWKAIGEKIDYIQRRMERAVLTYRKQLSRPKGKRGIELSNFLKLQIPFYEELYPVMRVNDALHLIDIFGQLASPVAATLPLEASVRASLPLDAPAEAASLPSDVPPEAASLPPRSEAPPLLPAVSLTKNWSSSKMDRGLEAQSTSSRLEKLEVEAKVLANREMRSAIRFKDYETYCELKKKKTDPAFIANCFPELIYFFVKDDFDPKTYSEYVKLYNDHVKKEGLFDPITM